MYDTYAFIAREEHKKDMQRQSLVELLGAFSKVSIADPGYRLESSKDLMEVVGERLARIEKFIDGVEATEKYLEAQMADRQGDV